MGIGSLKTFIEKRCPGGTQSVNISDLVEKCLTESGSSSLYLAIDTLSCVNEWYAQTNRDGFMGGQWKEYQMTLQKFIVDCKKLNLELLFFYDEQLRTFSQSKEWCTRQEDRLRDIENIFSLLDIGVISKKNTIPKTVPSFTKHILSSLEQKIIGVGDSKYNAMIFAMENLNCIGVLSNNSNYLAYPGGKPVFIPECFHPEENKALMWHKPSVIQALNLEENDMPVLACLLGNDLTTDYSEDLLDFRRRLGGDWVQSMASVLNIFKVRNGYKLRQLQNQVLPYCEEFIFSTVVNSYILPNTFCPWNQEGNNDIGKESARPSLFVCPEKTLLEAKEHSNWIFRILKFGVVRALPSYENDKIFEPEFVVYRYIRERLYGIILSEYNSECKPVEEWIGYNYKREVKLCHSVPVLYQGKQVELLQLWQPNYPRNDKIYIFEQCIGLAGHKDTLGKVSTNLPEYLIVSSYLLCYMAQKMTNLTQYDLSCLIECVIWCNDVSMSFIQALPQVIPTPRPVVLASHYCRGLQILKHANSVCGQPFKKESFIPTNTFDGLLFQNIYQKLIEFQKNSKDFRKLLNDICLDRIPSYKPINYVQKITNDIETLSLRPQRKK